MFAAVTKKLSKAIGEDTLRPSPSLDQASDCDVFHIVVKKKRRWSWRSPKYTPTAYTLHQLLVNSEQPLDVPTTREELTDFNDSSVFEVKGKIGGNIVSEAELELSGDDSVQITAKLGTISKQKVNIPLLQEELLERSLNMDHVFIKEVREKRRNVLGVVVATLSPTKDCSLVTQVIHEGDEDVSASVLSKVEGEEDLSVVKNKSRTLRVPANTPVAYHICELQITKEGKIKLLILGEGDGGFEFPEETKDFVDSPFEVSSEDESLYEMFKPLTGLEFVDFVERYWLTHWLHSLLACPFTIGVMQDIIGKAHAVVDGKTIEEMDLIQVSLKVDGKLEQWKDFLLRVQFVFVENKIKYPEDDNSGFLSAVHCVLAAMAELSDEQCQALYEWHGDNYKLLFYLVKETVEKSYCPKLDDLIVKDLFSLTSSPTKKFAESLGFVVVKSTNGDEELQLLNDNMCELQGALRTLYALWGSE
ncbi:gasdermin-E-like [Glandiceps talaboti]